MNVGKGIFAVLLAACLIRSGWADSPVERPKPNDPAVIGKWTRQQPSPMGRVRFVKEHTETKTIVTAFDEKGVAIYAHESEFRTEVSGQVRLLTFSNRTITAGPGAGQTSKEPSSFIYRVAGNQFIEVHGALQDDKDPPLMFVWERLEEK